MCCTFCSFLHPVAVAVSTISARPYRYVRCGCRVACPPYTRFSFDLRGFFSLCGNLYHSHTILQTCAISVRPVGFVCIILRVWLCANSGKIGKCLPCAVRVGVRTPCRGLHALGLCACRGGVYSRAANTGRCYSVFSNSRINSAASFAESCISWHCCIGSFFSSTLICC